MRITYLHSQDYARLTGGFVYNSRLVAALSGQGADVAEFSVPVAFPSIDAAGRDRLAAVFAALPHDAVLLSDHLHVLDLEPLLRQRSFRVVSVFHHAKTIEDRLNGNSVDHEAERRCFDVCDALIVTSEATAAYVHAHYGVAPARLIVALPGNDRVARSRGPVSDGREILTLGAVIPRKRQDYLIAVAAGLRASGWRWRIVGDLDRDPDYAAGLRRDIAAAGLAGKVELIGGVGDAELEELWARSALHVAASHHEGYGMAVAEALRHGVPVVTTASGAVATWADRGAVIAPADDPAAFAGMIDTLFAAPDHLRRLSDEAWTFGSALPGWDETFAGMTARLVEAFTHAADLPLRRAAIGGVA